MEFMSPFDLVHFISVGFEKVRDMNSPYYQHVTVFFNLTCSFTVQPTFIGRDSARYQRAA
jgi:hypothetical protein